MMRWFSRRFLLLSSLAAILGRYAGDAAVIAGGDRHMEAREREILSQIDERIRRHRTAPLRIQIVDSENRPLPGRQVMVQHERHLFQFGAAYHQGIAPKSSETESDRRHRDNFLRLFNAATVTFYWSAYEPQEGSYRDEELLSKIQWLKQQDLYLRGHPLFWNHVPACLPGWLQLKDLQPEDVRSLMDRTLQHLSAAIFPLLDDVDVFNELVYWEHYDHPLTALFQIQGKTAIASHYLRQFKILNPGVVATVNDFSTQPLYPELLGELLAKESPIDAIGQQAHMHRGYWSIPFFWGILQRLSTLNRPITLTEVSVLSGDIKPNLDYSKSYNDWLTTPRGEEMQANYLATLYRLCYSHPQVAGIYLWNFSDRGAWLGAPVGILRQDGSCKPAFERLEQLVNRTWRTHANVTTQRNGEVLIPDAYEGEYSIKVDEIEATICHRAASNQTVKIVFDRG